MHAPINLDAETFLCLKKTALYYSQGVDSTTLLWEYATEIALAVSFDYGSKHNVREIACAQLQCKSLGVEHLVIPLDFMARYFKSSLLKGGGDIEKGSYDEKNMSSTVVPFRNGIMLSIVAGLAESRGYQSFILLIMEGIILSIPIAVLSL